MPEKNRNTPMDFRTEQGDDEPVDAEVLESFAQDQELDQGRSLLKRRLQERTPESPELSAGDMDATWDDADGEEAGGGKTLEPDENVVDEVGGALGLSYSDTEPLHTDAKLERREHDAWELNPESDPEYRERRKEEFHEAQTPTARARNRDPGGNRR